MCRLYLLVRDASHPPRKTSGGSVEVNSTDYTSPVLDLSMNNHISRGLLMMACFHLDVDSL